MNEVDPQIPIGEVYSKALNLLQDQERWTQGDYTHDKYGNPCPWREGYSFCALGAVLFFADGFSHRATCCLQRVSNHLYGEHIQCINDKDPDAHKKVLKALEFARDLWKDQEPTEEELSMPVPTLLEKRLTWEK